MCRLLAVRSQDAFSPAPYLKNFAFIAKNSREFQGHGWGCAWLNPAGEWQIYRNIRPVWEDDFSSFPVTTLLVAHARSAFEDKDIVVENNMPFSDGKAVFVFNGELRGVKIREDGRIGAEKIFNFIRRFDSGDPLAALKKGTGIIRNRTRQIRGMNIIMVKDRRIYLSTYFQGDPEYFTMHCKEEGDLILCSDPFPDEPGWENIPNDTARLW
ncbi:MAG: class II glutamine amidotransferase [Deltaproteobacteria bacterium]